MLGAYVFILALHLAVIAKSKLNPNRDYSEVNLRMKSWWLITALFSCAVFGGKLLGFAFVALISFLALKEYFSLIPTRRADRRVLLWAYLSIPAQIYFLWADWLVMFYLFVPLYMFLIVPMRMVSIGETEGFIKSAGTIFWGMMATVYSVGYLAAFLIFPAKSNPVAGGVGLLLFLIILNSMNDAAQYFWGKRFGKNKIVPKVSPNKTSEGFLGGVFITTLTAVLVAPYLTPLSLILSVFAGLLVAFCGFMGDVVFSALKRDLGVKDSSMLIPGHGGVLDRIDSLIYTAPVFFHFTAYFYL